MLQGHVAIGMWQPPSCDVDQSHNNFGLANYRSYSREAESQGQFWRSYHRRVCRAMARMGILALCIPEHDSRFREPPRNGSLTHGYREVEERTASSGPTETAWSLRCSDLVVVSRNGLCGSGSGVPGGDNSWW